MKKPQIDIFANSVHTYIKGLGFKKKFLRLWGHNGSVLTEKHYYYPSISPNDVKLFKLLGIYKDLADAQGKMEGVEKAWVYLNPKKADVTKLDDDLLIQQLEFQIPDGIYTINIVPNVIHKRTGWGSRANTTQVTQDTLGLLNYADKTALGNYIKDNYAQVLDKYIVQPVGKTAIEKLVVMHIFSGSNAFTHTIKSVEYGLMNLVRVVETDEGRESYKYSVKSISVDIEIKQTGVVTTTDPLVKSILNQRAKAKAEAAAARAEKTSARINNDTLSEGLFGRASVTNDFFLANQMRVSIFDSKVLKTKPLIRLIQDSLDTGYEEKKAKWYQKLIAPIVFIVVFVLVIVSGGAAAPSLSLVATAFTVASLAVVALSAAMNAWGDEVGAREAGSFSQAMNKVGIVIGIVAIVHSITTALAREATKQVIAEAAKEGITLSTAEIAKQAASRSIIDTLKGMVADLFTSGVSTNLSLEQAMGITNRLAGMYQQNKLEKLSDKLKSLQQQNADNSNYEEEARSRDLGRALIKAHGELFIQDSVDKYDYMYEPWTSPMHIGNIQRTSWKWSRTKDKINLRDDSVE